MPEKLLNDQVIEQVREAFQGLNGPVEVLFFGKKADCEYCDETQQLVEEVSSLSDKITLKIYDIEEDAELADHHNVDKAPGLVMIGSDGDELHDYGVRFAGIPSGHEFSTLIHDLILVSGGDSGLQKETRDYLESLKQPLLLQVFVTPT
jgi:glutaredoxin-like protein